MSRAAGWVGWGVLGLAMAAGPALAQGGNCPCAGGTVLNATQIGQTLANQRVCATLVTGSVTERWAELHRSTGTGANAGGDLVDYKKGPSDLVDPSKTVGTWSIIGAQNGGPRVRYNNGAGGTYDYTLCQQNGNLHFCGAPHGGRNITGATLGSVATGCGFL